MTKKIAASFIIILLLLAGFALTQESDGDQPLAELENEIDEDIESLLYQEEEIQLPEWFKGERWFRSNAGGMALEEIPSRLAALRNEYALVIDLAQKEDIPDYLFPFYDDRYFIEIRVLFKKREQFRTQWVFRDNKGRARLVAAFVEKEAAGEIQTEVIEAVDSGEIHELMALLTENEINEAQTDDSDNPQEEEKPANKSSLSGFIEIYDENLLLSTEYRFFQDGGRSRTDYVYKDGLLVSSTVLIWEENDDGTLYNKTGQYVQIYTDYFRYNRSLFIRSVRRVFYKDRKISPLSEPVVVNFPSGILAAARGTAFIRERHNSYPDFFGDIAAKYDSSIIYSTDEKGRILSQALYDKDDNIIWVINNTWSDDRIVSTQKEEGDNIYLAEYEYDSGGDRVLERNFTNGVLQRVVRLEGKRDIEELYLNGNIILEAVWENGRKVSETRMR